MKSKSNASGAKKSAMKHAAHRKGRLFEYDENAFSALTTGRKTVVVLWENKFIIIALCLLLGIALGCKSYAASLKQATALLSLNYEESANGLYPNGTRLNMNDVKSDAVLRSAVASAGLWDVLYVGDLKDALQITPANTKSVSTSSENYYVATSYNISLNLYDTMPRISTQDLLRLVCAAYSDAFFDQYTENRSVLTVDINPDSYEYYALAEVLSTKAESLQRYISMRLNENSIYSDNGIIAQFKNLNQQLINFTSYDIEKFRSYIAQNGLAKDADTYSQALSYTNGKLDTEYRQYMAAYDADTEGIAMYNVNMSATVMIPTLAESNEFYMSKTKSEVDFLADDASSNLSLANAVYETMQINQAVISNIQSRAGSAAIVSQAEEMIDGMLSMLKTLASNIEENDKAYIRYKTRDYLTLQYGNPSLTERIDLKNCLFYCGVMVALLCVLIYLSQSVQRGPAPAKPIKTGDTPKAEPARPAGTASRAQRSRRSKAGERGA